MRNIRDVVVIHHGLHGRADRPQPRILGELAARDPQLLQCYIKNQRIFGPVQAKHSLCGELGGNGLACRGFSGKHGMDWELCSGCRRHGDGILAFCVRHRGPIIGRCDGGVDVRCLEVGILPLNGLHGPGVTTGERWEEG